MTETSDRGAAAAIAPLPSRDRALEIAKSQPPVKLRSAPRRQEDLRETVEPIVIAFVLAFLFRTFVTEAFVIPTGSMAPTLFGRHKDIVCSQCGTHYQVGASDEVDRDQRLKPNNRIKYGMCPNCRYRQDIYDDPVFKGDRILVNKFSYEFTEPRPWDVIVFRYPLEPKTNYIKRLIGLPGQTITIMGGDVYIQKSPDGRNEILRKPPVKQTAMKMFVHDDAHPAKELLAADWPESWQAVRRDGDAWQPDPAGWEAQREHRTYNISGGQNEPLRWLRYQHFIPSYDDWDQARAGQSLRNSSNREPLLIADYYPYNCEDIQSFGREILGGYWVGDLCLSCRVNVAAPQGSLVLELVESKRRYRCEIDLSNGQAELYYFNEALTGDRAADDAVDSRVIIGKVQTVVNRAGQYTLRLSNFDSRLTLWVNNRVVPLPQSGDYSFDPRSDYASPTNEDLCPVGVAARGAQVQVSDLRIDRDVFYTQGRADAEQSMTRFQLANPQEYFRAVEAAFAFDPASYALGPDEFFAMGDNSPHSADSRWWIPEPKHADTLRDPGHAWAVHRSLLIGKAFMIYWPHGVPFGNNGEGIPVQYHRETGKDGKLTDYPSFVVPFYPQFSRFKFIH